MAEEFSIVRCHNYGLAIHDRSQIFNLFFPVKHKIFCVELGFSICPFGNVDLFMIVLACDAKVLKAGVHSNAVSMNIGLDIIKVQIVGDVTIEFPVIIIPWIAFY